MITKPESKKLDLPSVTSEGLTSHLQTLIRNDTNTPFLLLVIQLANMESFQKRRSAAVVQGLFAEVGAALKSAIHSSQYVGRHQNGFAITLQCSEVGVVDVISKKLAAIVTYTIRKGKYNDFRSHWTDIIYEFLHPNSPGIIFPRVGWSIYPRDGSTPMALINRALFHLQELAR